MKGLKVLIVLIGIVFFGIENTYGQEQQEETVSHDDVNLKKINLNNLPPAVKKSVENIAGYTMKKAFYTLEKSKSSGKVYKVQIAKGAIVYNLIIDEEGKILETEE